MQFENCGERSLAIQNQIPLGHFRTPLSVNLTHMVILAVEFSNLLVCHFRFLGLRLCHACILHSNIVHVKKILPRIPEFSRNNPGKKYRARHALFSGGVVSRYGVRTYGDFSRVFRRKSLCRQHLRQGLVNRRTNILTSLTNPLEKFAGVNCTDIRAVFLVISGRIATTVVQLTIVRVFVRHYHSVSVVIPPEFFRPIFVNITPLVTRFLQCNLSK